MAYSTWRADNLSLIEAHTACEVLEAFTFKPTTDPATSTNPCSSNKEDLSQNKKTSKKKKTKVDGMTHRMSKKNLKWLQKARDIHQRKNRVVISEVTDLAKEACASMMSDMFEEDPSAVAPEDKATRKSAKIKSRQVQEEDYFSDSESESSDDDSEIEDNDDSNVNVNEMFKDNDFMKLLGVNNQDLQPEGMEGNLFGNLMKTAMTGIFNNPAIKSSVEAMITNYQEAIGEGGLPPEKEKKMKLIIAMGTEMVDAMNSGASKETIMTLYQKLTDMSNDPSLQEFNQPNSDETFDFSNMGNIGEEENNCSVM